MRPSDNNRMTVRLPSPTRAIALAAASVASSAALLAALAPSGPAAVAPGGAPLAVSVRLDDHTCSVPAAARSRALRFDIINRGRYAHTFAIAGRRSSPGPGQKAVLRVDFPRAGRYAYTCTRHGLPRQRGLLHVLGTPTMQPTAGKPCGVEPAPPAVYRHVVWIVMENKAWSDVIGSAAAPNVNRLAGLCGVAASFYGEAHPSLPNYIAMTSGGTQGVTDDAGPSSHQLSAANLFQQVGDWRALQESMPSDCATSDAGDYAVRHNPALYYVSLQPVCSTRDVPLGSTPDFSARFTFVTPDTCHDMHSSSCADTTGGQVRAGDTWLGSFLSAAFRTPQYRSGTTAIIVTWDESSHGDPATQRIPTLVIAPSVRPGTIARARFDHYSLLRTTEELLGLREFLGAAATAPAMRSAFHF